MLSSTFLWLAVAIGAGALVFWGGPKLRPVGELLLPMWLPLSVLVIAGIALFGTDQGRDLGIGLLGNETTTHAPGIGLRGNGGLQLVLLALALFYWATGSWHAARLGLNRKFGTDRAKWPAGYAAWLRWLPRLLGACAHLFAALILTLAAMHVVPPGDQLLGVPIWLFEIVPPAVIVVGVFVLWRQDHRYMAARDAFEQHQAAGGADPGTQAAYRSAERRLNRTIWLTIAVGLAIAGGLYLLSGRLPGLAPATAWVLVSAALFLLVVSYRKAIGRWVLGRQSVSRAVKTRLSEAFEETDERHAPSSTVLAAGLSIVAVLVAAEAWWNPVGLGRVAGSMVLGFFAFGAYIAVIDLIRLLSGTGPRFAAVCTFLVLLAVGTTATRDFHRVRLCGEPVAPCSGTGAMLPEDTAAARVEHRPTVAEAAATWYAQARRGWTDDTPVPMLVVATAGGGIRAAYWTATVLERLEQELGKETLRRHLFAISGVSGGSVGALAYVASTSDDAPSDLTPTKILDGDFLAPALASLAFVDGPSSVLPDLHQGDRGSALEQAWEVGSGGILARPFLSFFPSKEELGKAKAWRPALLLNSTHQSTGRRVITSHLQVEQRVFLDSFDTLALVQRDMPASTAGHNSARFTYVSPAGKLVPPVRAEDGPSDFGYLLDGGYFENFGAITALQLLREARAAIGTDEDGRPRVRPVVLQISSDPSLSERDRARTASLCQVNAVSLPFEPGDRGEWLSSANELTAPIAGLLASRVAHGTLASQELAWALCREQKEPAPSPLEDLLATAKQEPGVIRADGPAQTPRRDQAPIYAHLAMCHDEHSTVPPLGWVLSPQVETEFVQILEHQCHNDDELKAVLDGFLRPEM